jgi:hypothetical protein
MLPNSNFGQLPIRGSVDPDKDTNQGLSPFPMIIYLRINAASVMCSHRAGQPKTRG